MAKSLKKNQIKQYKDEWNGQEITVNRFKPKDKKGRSYGRTVVSNCPCCGSKLHLNDAQVWECTSDKLKYWESEFNKYAALNDAEKVQYLQNISSDSQFFDLYDKWKAEPQNFNCGYSNNIFLPIANTRTIIPDPIFVKKLEEKLKRALTEEELMNEGQLYFRHKKYSDKWFKGSKQVVIPYIVLPDETSFTPKPEEP